jgi:hypothetical protein
MRCPSLLATAVLVAMIGTLPALQPPAVPANPAAGGTSAPADQPKGNDTPAAKREAPDGPPEFEAKFIDDSVLKVIALDSVITLSTKYGRLTVPLADVVRLELGFRFPDGVEAKVEQAVANLGSPSFREREDAEKELFKLAEYAVPALRRASNSPDPEVARRAGTLLKKLADKLPEEKMSLRDYDLLETAEATVRGRVETVSVRVRNRVLGETALRMIDLRSMRSTVAVGNEFTVEARFARQNSQEWFDTGLDVTTDQPLEITADGTVDLAPQNPGQYISGPGGNPANGNSMMILPNGNRMQVIPGALYARIGPTGTAFLVGANHKSSRPQASGRLYLKIAQGTWGGVEPTGSYKVKVRVGG